MGKAVPKKIARYGDEFRLNAVKLNQAPGVFIKNVADSLCVHPFLLSHWRKQVREGKLVGNVPESGVDSVAELKRLRGLKLSGTPIAGLPAARSRRVRGAHEACRRKESP